MKKHILALSALAAILSGCSSTGTYKDRDFIAINAYPTRIAQSPEKGSETEVEPGGSMLSSARHAVVPAIRLEQGLNHRGKYSDIYNSLITVPGGLLTASGKDESGTFYESDHPVSFIYHHIEKKQNSEAELLRGGIYIPTDISLPPEVYWHWEGEPTPSSDPHPGLSYKAVSTERINKDGFKRELVYSGMSQNTISIVYREFKDDLTRPTYFQDLKYDLSKGNVIAYQGARFQVIKADNTKVRYKVLNPLD